MSAVFAQETIQPLLLNVRRTHAWDDIVAGVMGPEATLTLTLTLTITLTPTLTIIS